jgi:hypothetical protein
VEPTLETTVSLCVSDHRAISPAAQVVKQELAQVVAELVGSGQGVGTRLPPATAA